MFLKEVMQENKQSKVCRIFAKKKRKVGDGGGFLKNISGSRKEVGLKKVGEDGRIVAN